MYVPLSKALYTMPEIRKIKLPKSKIIYLLSLFIAPTWLSASAFASESIDGIWKHATKPALIEFNLKTGIASVKEHQTHKENSGLTVIKNIIHSSKSKTIWSGEMFNGYKDKYETVTIKLNGKTVSVLDSQNNEVLKLVKE